MQFNFQKQSFTKTSGGDFGIHLKNKGYYHIVNDTLILMYDNPDDERVTVIEQKKLTDSLGVVIPATSLEFEVVHSDNSKAIEALIVVRDKENKGIKGFVVNASGRCTLLLSAMPEAHHITLDNLNDEVTINVAEYAYKNTSLRIVLTKNPSRYSDYKGVKKYFIKKIEKDKIQLIDLESKELFFLKKNNER